MSDDAAEIEARVELLQLREAYDRVRQRFFDDDATEPQIDVGEEEKETMTDYTVTTTPNPPPAPAPTATPPSPTYTAAQVAAAREQTALLNAELRESATPEGHVFRTARLAELERLRPIAYYEAPPAPHTGPTLAQRVAARTEQRQITRALLNEVPEGHPDRQLYLDRFVELSAITNHDEIAKASAPPSHLDLIPREMHREPWVGEVKTVAERAGLASSWAPLLHLVAAEVAGGRRGTSDEECVAELHAKHGPERADAICDAAREAAKHLPSGFRAYLASHNLLASPPLVEALGRAWLRRGASR